MARKRDENETAFDTLQEILRRDAERDGIPVSPKPNPEKMAVRVKAGRKGGKIGGSGDWVLICRIAIYPTNPLQRSFFRNTIG